ncbi:hypothetical protein [Streptomyces sp. DH12]|uniref:hypothetical protein n=1 Tax=Streptomyces sp. DH12 TaxID=2857010 RepID=UPI001E4FC5F1|nr:hypothetical protein [Streptomyces sp. DH12]
MATSTIMPATTVPADTSEYAAGRADAQDDARALTIRQLQRRAAHYTHHATLPRAMGYVERVWEIGRERAALATAESKRAYADRAAI